MIDQSGSSGLKLSDIESTFGLHELHHKTTLTRKIFTSITSVLFLVGAVLILYARRKNFDCFKKRQVNRKPISMSALQLSATTTSSWIPVSGPAVANLQDFDSSDNNDVLPFSNYHRSILNEFTSCMEMLSHFEYNRTCFLFIIPTYF